VVRSSFVQNTSATMGGAAYIESGGVPGTDPVLTFTNSTLSGNTAAHGGGVAFDFGLQGTVWFRFSTIAGNNATTAGAGGGVHTDNVDQFVLFQGGTIVSGNTAAGVAANCAGAGSFDSLGNNLEFGNSCGLDQTTDQVNTDPLLAPLAFNAGGDQTTRTHGLFDTSPALNQVPAIDCPTPNVDQRSVTRAAPCDKGAFEGSVGPAPFTPPVVNPPVTAPTPPTPAKVCPKKKKKKKKKRSASAAKKKKKKKKKKRC
jgi:hypothetical protein